ncbi:hypothetical protein NAL32_16880 [Chryseobacterium sp. Ch-15]|uniref:Lipoprotein n=1 Tax=Chryseobacterium muglaense TaxID=2893752 RepID=A0A9Q3YQA5_9FLAO|nr:hypothetical protein [Chryseobacterium muglaense]MBD3906362.1 hypothetical protein [Chryseobacterium muglaense]MCC9033609.1 hypothetical protein [Chryseobacterium muglaense]MCM2556061.1 hypothetical protein [Chryseobacterium muglaense]
MLKKLLLLLCFSLILISCKKDCYTAPEKVVFEFVNSSGENLIQNGNLTTYSIMRKTGQDSYTSVELTQTDDYKVILKNVGSFNGTQEYRFTAAPNIFFFSIKSSNVTTDCDGYQIDEINFEDVVTTKESGYYRIVLD